MWSHCGLHLHSPDDEGGCTFSSLPLYIIGVCFREIPFKPFAYFSMVLFAFLFVCLFDLLLLIITLFSLETANFF